MSAQVVCRFPDEDTAIAVAAELGTELAPGTRDAGNENYALHVFTQWDRWPGTNGKDDPGEQAPGFWVNTVFNLDTEAGAAAHEALLATPYVVAPTNPSNVWA